MMRHRRNLQFSKATTTLAVFALLGSLHVNPADAQTHLLSEYTKEQPIIEKTKTATVEVSPQRYITSSEVIMSPTDRYDTLSDYYFSDEFLNQRKCGTLTREPRFEATKKLTSDTGGDGGSVQRIDTQADGLIQQPRGTIEGVDAFRIDIGHGGGSVQAIDTLADGTTDYSVAIGLYDVLHKYRR